MGDDLAGANVNRTYSLAAMSLAIFTFMLLFLYPRYANAEIDPLLFQLTLVVMGLATFALVFASFHYYAASLGGRMEVDEQTRIARRADGLWMVGYTLLFLVPSLVLLTVQLVAVAAVWFGLWLAYLVFSIRTFPRVRAR